MKKIILVSLPDIQEKDIFLSLADLEEIFGEKINSYKIENKKEIHYSFAEKE